MNDKKWRFEYKTLTAYDTELLDEQVTVLLNDGWKPQGGVSCCVDTDHDIFFAQAMTKVFEVNI